MPAPFQFELVSPERLLLSEPVEAVTVPGSEGDFTVLIGHAAMMSTIRPGFITVTPAGGGAQTRIYIRGGFAEVSGTSLTILAEQAIPAAELHPDEIARQVRNAEEDVADAKTPEARAAAQTRLEQLRTIQAGL